MSYRNVRKWSQLALLFTLVVPPSLWACSYACTEQYVHVQMFKCLGRNSHSAMPQFGCIAQLAQLLCDS